MDLLPIDVLRRILCALTTTAEEEEDEPSLRNTSWRFSDTKVADTEVSDTKEALKTCIVSKSFLEASFTLPDLNFYNAPLVYDAKHRDKLVNYLNHTLARYKHHNLPIRTLRLTTSVNRDQYFAKFLHQWIRNCDEYYQISEIHLFFILIPHSNLVQSIFSCKKLVSLRIHGCFFSDNHYLINCSSLRKLELFNVDIDKWLLDELFHSCPLIEGLHLLDCPRLSEINVSHSNLPNLKWLQVKTFKNQIVVVNVPSLELLTFGGQTDKFFSPDQSYSYLLTIHSTQNLKGLKLQESTIDDGQFHNLIANCPVLEELILDSCIRLNNITVSSQTLAFLRLNLCQRLMEVNINAPSLTEFEYIAWNIFPSLSFTSGDSRKRNSSVTLSLRYLDIDTVKLPEFLKSFKSSDNISLTIGYNRIHFGSNIINDSIVPEFEIVHMGVSSPFSKDYFEIMERLLASVSPKILVVKKDTHENFVKYLCKELLLVEEDNLNNSTRLPQSWRNYFRQVKLDGIGEKWRPLHSWESMEDVLENLGDRYIMKLSHT